MGPVVSLSRTTLLAQGGLRMPNALVWSMGLAAAIQSLAEATRTSATASSSSTTSTAAGRTILPGTRAGAIVCSGVVAGHTTPAVSDIGCASLRLQIDQQMMLRDGGYLMAVGLPGRRLLPAIAGVPGNRGGPDRDLHPRVGLAELVVMARPLDEVDQPAVTFVHHQVLQRLFTEGSQVDVVVLQRLTDFFTGLNAGTWLKIRMKQISEASGEFMGEVQEGCEAGELLRGTGLAPSVEVEPPPEDMQWLFDHWGAGGNTGVSGQKTFSSFDPNQIY